MIETATDDVSGLSIHAKFTINDHAKITNLAYEQYSRHTKYALEN